ncbi:hypothetical protein ACLOJK_006210 [Asimina triloba]
MREADDGPSRAGSASEDGEYEEPREEEDEYVRRPNAWVHEPFRVLVQIRRLDRLHIQFRHSSSPNDQLIPIHTADDADGGNGLPA